MAENELDTKTVLEKNKRIFRNGKVIGYLGSSLTFWGAWYSFNFVPPGDPINTLIVFIIGGPILFGGLILVVTLVQRILKNIYFPNLDENNIEISGVKKRNFYAIELVIALLPFILLVCYTLEQLFLKSLS